MFRKLPQIKIIIFLTLMLTLPVGLNAQQQEQNVNKLREESLAQFSSGDYTNALSGFRSLILRFPRDPLYQYYAGTCLLKLNREPEEAIRLLGSSVDGVVPADAWYQLAVAYQREYRFDEARKAIQGFRDHATRQEIKAADADLFAASLDKAGEITRTYNPYEVLNVTFINFSDSADFSQIRMKGGNLSRKPQSFFAANESRVDLNSLMFMPVRPERNEYIYYSGLARSGKDGFQLYRIKKGLKDSWSSPEELSALNSKGNEILPYFDPIGKDIYFASDGFPGVGGFDLYKSHYNEEKDEWTVPVNLGFPINSSADEYLLLPGSDLGMVMFFSSRQGTDSTTTVYRVHFSEPRQPVSPDTPDQLKEIANLGNIAVESLEQMEAQLAKQEKNEMNTRKPEAEEKESQDQEKKEEIQHFVPAQHPTANPTYQSTLSQALLLQAEADSLSGLATSARVKVRDSQDPNDRWLYQKQIIVWEKRAAEAQGVADSCYQLLSTLDRNAPAEELPASIEQDKVIGDMTVYKYKNEEPEKPVAMGPAGEPGEVVEQVVVEEEKILPVKPEVINRFEVLASSPYNAANAIPVDMPLPKGTFYRVQLGAYSKPVAGDAFGGITPITAENFPDRGLIKYYAGKFSRYEDAQKALNYLRTNGYPDAYIIAWYNGTLMAVSKARELEL